jgi:hypothetical protein
MKQAIEQINLLIHHHEKDLKRHLDFFSSDKYKESVQEGSVETVIEHTERIYGELIEELKQALEILKENDKSS